MTPSIIRKISHSPFTFVNWLLYGHIYGMKTCFLQTFLCWTICRTAATLRHWSTWLFWPSIWANRQRWVSVDLWVITQGSMVLRSQHEHVASLLDLKQQFRNMVISSNIQAALNVVNVVKTRHTVLHDGSTFRVCWIMCAVYNVSVLTAYCKYKLFLKRTTTEHKLSSKLAE